MIQKCPNCGTWCETEGSGMLQRFGDGWLKSVEKLLRTVSVKKLFPMHLWGEFGAVTRYRAAHPQRAETVMPITRDGEVFPL